MSLRRADAYPTAYHGGRITPDIFVWHSTYGGAKAWLDQLFSGRITNSGSKITVHFAIYKDGDLVEYAPWKRGEAVACWHAGLSEFAGRTSANFFSLGCEIQHAPGEDFTVGQLEAIEYLTRMVQAEYPALRHTTHKFISGRLQGKTDPYSPQWEAQAWPVVQRALGTKTAAKEEEDMTEEQDRLLRYNHVRLLGIGQELDIIRAKLEGATAAELAKMNAAKEAAVAAERKQLGI